MYSAADFIKTTKNLLNIDSTIESSIANEIIISNFDLLSVDDKVLIILAAVENNGELIKTKIDEIESKVINEIRINRNNIKNEVDHIVNESSKDIILFKKWLFKLLSLGMVIIVTVLITISILFYNNFISQLDSTNKTFIELIFN